MTEPTLDASPPVPRQIDYRQVARVVAIGRVLVGAGLTLAPGWAGRSWVGPAASDPATKVAFRAMGIRDLALGAGTLQALASGESARTWVALAGVSDAVDAIATALAIRRLPLRNALPLIGIAAGSASFAAVAASRLDGDG
jgi:hypothetical protein